MTKTPHKSSIPTFCDLSAPIFQLNLSHEVFGSEPLSNLCSCYLRLQEMALNLFLLSFERSSRPFMVTRRGMERAGRSSAGIPAVVILGTQSHRLQSRAWHGTTATHSWAHGSTEGSHNIMAWVCKSFSLYRGNWLGYISHFYNLG